jgi:hypothetical protein
MLRRKLLWIGLMSVLVLGMSYVLGEKTPRAYANVTLVSFTARSDSGLPRVVISWETATEIDTAGFYVQRSLTNTADSYTRVSPFVSAEGDSVTGAEYVYTDTTTVLNATYYYRLEEVPTDAAKPTIKHEPVVVIAGVAPTQTPTVSPTATRTPTQTPTPTPTRTPTLTLTPPPSTTSTNTPAPTNPPVATATPRLVTGATITPRPTTARVEIQPTTTRQPVATQQPAAVTPSPVLATALPNNEQPTLERADATPVSDQTVPPTEVAAAPVLVVSQPAPDAVEPVVVVTEITTPSTKPAESRSGGLLLIIGAAAFLLIGALLMLRQASK